MDTYTSCHASELQEGVIYMPPQIYWAAAQGDIDIIRREMDRADQYLTPNKNTILHIAAQFGQLNCVQRIIENYREEYSSALLQWPNLKGDSPLHMAAREGHLEIVNALICAARELPRTDIESGIEADKAMLRMTNNDNDTALHEAVRYHHPQVVKLLTQEDLEFTYGANFSGGTPLYMAAERGFTDLVKIIIENTVRKLR